MPILPLNINMLGRIAVIIGGGAVALRKLRSLLTAGAAVRLVAVDILPEILLLRNSGLLTVRTGDYAPGDLADAFLVIAATSNPLVNEKICSDADKLGILVSSTSNPADGNCFFPALLQRGTLQIAVSTGGRCPAFAATVRDRIAEKIGVEYAAILDELAEEREKLLTNGSPSTYNTQVLRSHAERLLAALTDHERKEPLS